MIAAFAVSSLNAGAALKQKIIIASGKKALLVISLSPTASEPEKFAAAELVKYLHHISGAVFRQINNDSCPQNAICLAFDEELSKETYSIRVTGNSLFLTGGSGRAVLFAAYDLLERLGCRWFAPAFSFYEGQTEFIPHKAELSFESNGPVLERPAIKYRKLDVEEGLSHSVASLKEMIDWMPRLRFNTLMVPLNYGGGNRVMWDNWRRELTPELKKRGLMIEVGGHGYQNFLNAEMDDNGLFKKHPAWFGKNRDCEPDAGGNLVFNTSNKDAVGYLIFNVVDYLKSHTEIDVFDFWPPDGARWAECPEMAGTRITSGPAGSLS